jgi:fumarate reductase subunit D
MADDKEVQEGKIFAILSYLSILCLIPLLMKKDNKFVLHHAKQGLVIFIAGVALGILVMIPFLGWVLAPIGSLLLLILSLVGIIQVLQGNYWKCPVIYDISVKINI